MPTQQKLLVANRGEIAIRVFRAATIYAEEDRFSRHRFKADEAYQLNKEKGPAKPFPKPRIPSTTSGVTVPVTSQPSQVPRKIPPPGSRNILPEKGPVAFSKWIKNVKRLLITDTTMRDAHQSLIATRMLAIAEAYANRTPNLFSMEMWGGATFDTSMRFLKEDPWDRLRQLRQKSRLKRVTMERLPRHGSMR